jgi:hypothetical protein
MESEPNAKPIARTQIDQLSKFALLERKLQGNAVLARAQLEIAMRAQRDAQAALDTALTAVFLHYAPAASVHPDPYDDNNHSDDSDF